ncbi:uroporphyrinogen-III C-methyltransferase [Paraliomyxa miuraensis]|uniref:uroporphyrinogen-III C-methyltransferase n=1 Tax=Paraliomyxa miuraensis TaxID=376150 RepID=UPI002259295C|nr:uroporphyrinogen-III C-methyltransferase [Paraliomyxa miuraensis]MCX4243144.1 uroporphyrinogen-III C-methyltransferase [Paraliomyxa miuraensis]
MHETDASRSTPVGTAGGVGMVSIVGAGPWDPELLTLAGRRRLRQADVVIADYLANPALLAHCPPHVVIHQRTEGSRGYRSGAPRLASEGPLRQSEINRLMIEHARAGRSVVRLKGGDPCMFGRGGEEAQALREAGIPFELIPGVSAPIAAPEAAGIPVTHRHFTPAVTFVSGWEAYEKAGLQVAWEHLAKSAGTLVLMMSIRNARANAERLIAAGRDPSTPAAIVRWGTRGIQHTVVGELSTIADRARDEGIRPPAVLVVGEVVRLREQIQWLEQRPLHGRRVVVTRAADQAEALLTALGQLGADAVALPCLEVAPPEDPSALRTAVASIGEHDGVVLTSPNGVRAFFGALDEVELDARALAGKHVVAVGAGTAAACRRAGVRADLVPAKARSEGLVELLRAHDLLHARWLHVRADEGRDVLASAVAEAGGTLSLAVGYRTTRPAVPQRLLASLRAPADGGEGFHAVTLASGKTARHLLLTLGEALGDDEARRLLDAAKVVCLGPVTAAEVQALGLRVDAIADAPTDEAVITALRTVLDTQP